MSERPPDDPLERHQRATAAVLAILLTELGVVELDDQMCRHNGESFLWTARFGVTNEAIDRAIDQEPRHEAVELELNYHRERLIGHWLITGSEDALGKAFHFDDEQGALDAYDLAEQYLAGSAS